MSRGADLRLAVAQSDAVLEDVASNAARLAALLAGHPADLTVTPELSLTGYSLEAAAARLATAVRSGETLGEAGALAALPGDCVVGLPAHCPDGPPFNAAFVLRSERVRHVHHKRYLPTYGMFDEARFFSPGADAAVYDGPAGWRVGVLVCEDLWHPALPYLLAVRGAELIAVLAAAPGRGVWDGSAERGGRFASWEHWERLARVTAQTHGIYLVLANRVGVEGPTTFAGGSMIVGPDGAVLARADDRTATVLEATASRDAVGAARAASPHRRDEDPVWLAARLSEAAAGDPAGPTVAPPGSG